MTILTESILAESPSARDSQLAKISQEKASEILIKVKSLFFALWKDHKIVTTQQVAQFYEISEEILK